jgi:hypothetical protein
MEVFFQIQIVREREIQNYWLVSVLIFLTIFENYEIFMFQEFQKNGLLFFQSDSIYQI